MNSFAESVIMSRFNLLVLVRTPTMHSFQSLKWQINMAVCLLIPQT